MNVEKGVLLLRTESSEKVRRCEVFAFFTSSQFKMLELRMCMNMKMQERRKGEGPASPFKYSMLTEESNVRLFPWRNKPAQAALPCEAINLSFTMPIVEEIIFEYTIAIVELPFLSSFLFTSTITMILLKSSTTSFPTTPSFILHPQSYSSMTKLIRDLATDRTGCSGFTWRLYSIIYSSPCHGSTFSNLALVHRNGIRMACHMKYSKHGYNGCIYN